MFTNPRSATCNYYKIFRMRILKGLWFFYQKLIIPSLVLSILLSLLIMKLPDFFIGIGISFIFFTPTIHFFIYEVNNPNEYYFYYNLGLSRLNLWLITIVISIISGVILMLL